MQHLERAHAHAHVAAQAIREQLEPNAHLAPAARRIERGLVALYDAFDGRADRPTSVAVARARLWEAAILVARGGLPAALAALREACGELISAEERYPRVPLAARAAVPLRCGEALPPFHTIERVSVTPAFRAPAVPEAEPVAAPALALPEPTTFAELAAVAAAMRKMAAQETAATLARLAKAAERRREEPEAIEPEEPPPGFAFVPAPPLTEEDFIRRWARTCIEDVGMLGIQRTPLVGDDFRTTLTLEKRLVMALDALAALGPVAVAYVEPHAMDAPAADPMRVFAIAMIGACFEGRDVLAGAERVLHRFGPGDPAVAAAFVSALKLGPNPFVPGVLRMLYAAGNPACRAIAVEVLAQRGWLTAADFAALADEEDPRVFALTLPALAVARDRNLERALVRGLEHADRGVQAAALDAMALAAHPRAAAAARVAASGALGDGALVRVAIAGDEEDARWLLERMKAAPTAAAVEAIGWAGLVEAVPALLGLLGAEAEEVKLAAGAALERMLGAKLVDTIEVMPEALEDVVVAGPDTDTHAVVLASDPNDPLEQPSAGSAETLEVASTDPARWHAYWVEHGRRYDPKQRLRRGNPYSPSVSLYELDQLGLSPEDRRRLHRELAVRTGKLTHFDPHDFVLVQERSLVAWGALVKAMVETPGAWGRPRAR